MMVLSGVEMGAPALADEALATAMGALFLLGVAKGV